MVPQLIIIMPKVNPEIEAFARIKVVGVGGSGRNAVNHMVRSKVGGVEFIVANTDAQDLHNSLAGKKIHIGKNLTRGLGTGMNPELGKRAAEETKEEIQEVPDRRLIRPVRSILLFALAVACAVSPNRLRSAPTAFILFGF